MNPVKNHLTVKVPAKINLSLDIVGRKENGYHLLEMVMQSIGLYDTLTLTVQKAPAFSVAISCNRPWIPTDERNIVYKAAKAFFGEGEHSYQIGIDIYKKIPDQAGMAGGSADAAGVFIALNEMFGTPYTGEQLCEIGLTVGADVPYCIHGGTAFVSGIGEEIKPLRQICKGYVVGARPKVGISTKAAYQGFDEANPGVSHKASSPRTAAILKAVDSGDLSAISDGLFNVFEEVCGVKEVAELKQSLLELGALGALMSGSGSAVYGIFTTTAEAKKAYEVLKKTAPAAFFAPIRGNVLIAD